MKSSVLWYVFVFIYLRLINGQQLTKEDVLNIPHINDLPPLAAYHTEQLNITISLYINELELTEKNGEFRMYGKLIWLAKWNDNRLRGIKTDVYYFNENQIWSPEVHSYNNELTELKIKPYYTDTISVRKNGEVESTVFEDFERSCRLTEINTVSCKIGLAGYFTFVYNHRQNFVCMENDCFKFTDSYLKIGNESRRWNLKQTSVKYLEFVYNDKFISFDVYFSRSVVIASKVIEGSPIVLVILLAVQFLLPIHSKIRFIINSFCYILAIMMVLQLQFEFFNLDIDQEKDIGVFYTAALFFITLSWMWNALSGNIWISCSHEYKPSLDTCLSRLVMNKYLGWIIPREIVESESFLMKLIFLFDKLVCVIVVIFMMCMVVKIECFVSLWRI